MSSKSHFFRQSGYTPFIATFRTSADNQNIELPYTGNGAYDGVIDWGDGTSSVNDYANRFHNYAVAGDYDVTIKGLIQRLVFSSNSTPDKIIDIKQWGGNVFLQVSNGFKDCVNLDITATDTPQFLGDNQPSWFRSFFRNSFLVFNSSFENWTFGNTDVSSRQSFYNAFLFNQKLELFRNKNMLDVSAMFQGCTIFNQELNFLNVDNNGNFSFCFQNAFAFNKPLNNWNTSSGVTFRRMFQNAYAFNQDISDWDFSSCANNSSLEDFMAGKTDLDYSSTYYDNLLIKWASDPSVGGLPVGVISTIDMGTIKYTSNGASARASILANNKAVTINDGGQI